MINNIKEKCDIINSLQLVNYGGGIVLKNCKKINYILNTGKW